MSCFIMLFAERSLNRYLELPLLVSDGNKRHVGLYLRLLFLLLTFLTLFQRRLPILTRYLPLRTLLTRYFRRPTFMYRLLRFLILLHVLPMWMLHLRLRHLNDTIKGQLISRSLINELSINQSINHLLIN